MLISRNAAFQNIADGLEWFAELVSVFNRCESYTRTMKNLLCSRRFEFVFVGDSNAVIEQSRLESGGGPWIG